MDLLKELGISKNNFGACIGGVGWLESTDLNKLDSVNPSIGETIASIYQATEHDYEQVVSAAEKSFHKWKKVPAPVRGQLVREIGTALRAKKDALGSLISLEMGKIKQEGDGEVQEMIDIADFAVGQSRMLYGKTMHSERQDHRMYEQWHPLGNVGVITAFNFPVAVWAWNACLAAICGNITIWKPSSSTPLCAVAVQNIVNDVLKKHGHRGIFNTVIGQGSVLGERLLKDKRIQLVSFTGSTKMGRHVSTTVTERFGKTILELGGNNAIIVDETADMDMVIPSIAFGAVGTAGQRCTSTRRTLVQESRYDELVKRLVNAYEQVKIGDPLAPDTHMGPLVNRNAVADFKNALSRVWDAGGEILFGGRTLTGNFVQPTIIKAENYWDIVQEETFAPILYIITYKTLNEAIDLHNDVPQGLSSAMFTTNISHAERFLSSVGSDCGIANINIGTSGAEIGGAFGGEKETGGGRESGSDSWKQYMRRQTNTINWSNELPLAQEIKFDLTV